MKSPPGSFVAPVPHPQHFPFMWSIVLYPVEFTRSQTYRDLHWSSSEGKPSKQNKQTKNQPETKTNPPFLSLPFAMSEERLVCLSAPPHLEKQQIGEWQRHRALSRPEVQCPHRHSSLPCLAAKIECVCREYLSPFFPHLFGVKMNIWKGHGAHLDVSEGRYISLCPILRAQQQETPVLFLPCVLCLSYFLLPRSGSEWPKTGRT